MFLKIQDKFFFFLLLIPFLFSNLFADKKKNTSNLHVTTTVDVKITQTFNTSKIPHFKYAVFDICKSFWKKSLYDLLYAYQKQKKIPWSYYFKMVKFGISYALGTLDPKEAYESFLSYCKGTSLQELKKNCSQLWEKECKNFIFKDAKKLFKKHKSDRCTMILAEAGFAELYEDLCAVYKFDYLCTSQLEFKGGGISGKLVGAPCSAKEKYLKVKNLIKKKLNGSLKDVIFYANSYNDIPLLEKVGKAVAVNPDSKLEAYAKKKGWEILKFDEICS